jgi:PAS domain S-box-containing protein
MDITELKEARRKLEDSEQNLSQIIEGTSVPTFVLDKNHRIIHWNRVCETLTGIPGRQVIGTNMQWSAFYRNKRSTMADFIVDGELEESFAAHYEGRQRKSALIEGGLRGGNLFSGSGFER